MSPNVSVIVPNFNYAQYLGACIESVLAQTYGDFELIVVDDGSSDGSPQIARNFTDPRVRVIVQANAGVSAARNRGVQASSGRWIAFLDSDDLWTPDSLRLRVEASEAAYGTDDRPIFTCGQSLRVPRYTTVADIPQLMALEPDGRRFNMSTILTERGIFEKLGWFREDIRYREDKELWYRLVGKAYFKSYPRDPTLLDLSRINLVWITDLCALYRKHRRSATHSFRRFPRRVRSEINLKVEGV